MPKRGSFNYGHTSGGGRVPTHDIAGPAETQAQPHNRRPGEQPPPKGMHRQDEYTGDIAPRTDPAKLHTHAMESEAGVDDKVLHERLPELDNSELARLAVLDEGIPLKQGSVYVDLNDPARAPFKALGGQSAGKRNRYIAKEDTDYELWNRLVGQDTEPHLVRPETADESTSS